MSDRQRLYLIDTGKAVKIGITGTSLKMRFGKRAKGKRFAVRALYVGKKKDIQGAERLAKRFCQIYQVSRRPCPWGRNVNGVDDGDGDTEWFGKDDNLAVHTLLKLAARDHKLTPLPIPRKQPLSMEVADKMVSESYNLGFDVSLADQYDQLRVSKAHAHANGAAAKAAHCRPSASVATKGGGAASSSRVDDDDDEDDGDDDNTMHTDVVYDLKDVVRKLGLDPELMILDDRFSDDPREGVFNVCTSLYGAINNGLYSIVRPRNPKCMTKAEFDRLFLSGELARDWVPFIRRCAAKYDAMQHAKRQHAVQQEMKRLLLSERQKNTVRRQEHAQRKPDRRQQEQQAHSVAKKMQDAQKDSDSDDDSSSSSSE